tara:strand:+ start:12631 stop:13017 length:387 start_codon:yes stop_codon:yes gene_type:complete
MGVWLILLAGANPPVVVPAIEFNNCYDKKGVLLFRQIILWERRYVRGGPPKSWRGPWEPDREVVVAWRIVKRWPSVSKRGGRLRILLPIKEDGWVVVLAGSVSETWTQHDPEVENRKVWPASRRRSIP